MGWVTAIMAILGGVAEALPVVERLLSGIGTFISTEFQKLFPGDAANKVSSAIDQAEALINSLDVGAVDTIKWLSDMLSTASTDPAIQAVIQDVVTELEKLWPGITKGVYAAHNIAGDHGVGFGTALAVVVSQHAAVRTGKTTVTS